MRFPALDITRLAIRHQPINAHFCRDVTGFFPNIVSSLTPEAPVANQMLALRILCNAFNQSDGVQRLVALREDVIGAGLSLQSSANKNVQIALASVLLNYSVALGRAADLEARSHCIIAAVTILESSKEPEALFRLFVALGNLVHDSDEGRDLCTSMSLGAVLEEYAKRNDLEQKVTDCAKSLARCLQ